MMATAGMSGAPGPLQAEYRIELRSRSGAPVESCRFNDGIIGASYGRQLDNESTASVRVTAPDETEGVRNAVPRPWHDLLVFWRGDNPEPVWRGPVTRWDRSASELTISAVDGIGEMGDRTATRDHPALGKKDPSVNPLDLFAWIMAEANRHDELPLIVMPPVRPIALAPVLAPIAEGDNLRDALNKLAADWVDWTVCGTRLFYGAPTILLPELPRLDTATSWLEDAATLSHDGAAYASDVEVLGAGGVLARWPEKLSTGFYRPLRLTRPELTSKTQALQLAKDVWAEAQRPLVMLGTSGSLSPDCPIPPEDMIPGRVVWVGHGTGDEFALYVQRLGAMTVEIGSVADIDGWALAEMSVGVELQPGRAKL